MTRSSQVVVPPQGATAYAAPPFAAAVARIFELSFGQMLWSRRSVFLALLLGGPVLFAILIRVVATMSVVGTFRVSGTRIGGATIFGLMIWLLYIRFIIPVLGVFYGTSLFADEVDDRT